MPQNTNLPRIIASQPRLTGSDHCQPHQQLNDTPPDPDGVCGGCLEHAHEVVAAAALLDPAAHGPDGHLRRSVREHISLLSFAQAQAALDRHHCAFDSLSPSEQARRQRLPSLVREQAQAALHEQAQREASSLRAQRDAQLRILQRHPPAPAAPERDLSLSL